MDRLKILSWNVNGIRAVYRKGFVDWLKRENPDIICLQEIKAVPEQIPEEIVGVKDYQTYFAPAQRKGYSGVGILTRRKPRTVKKGFGQTAFDSEGRTLIADYGDFMLFSVYFPNGGMSDARLAYKMSFYDAFLRYIKRLEKKGKKLIICGDVNTAHTEIDIARPKENEKVSGFLPEERAWIDRLISAGFIDTYRIYHKEGGNYTWWDYKSRARQRNIGWRLDYFFISANIRSKLKSAFIMSEVQGSDHCPVGIEIELIQGKKV
jgi:exodeoxyribonuclease-3